jgi:hypothetical protein
MEIRIPFIRRQSPKTDENARLDRLDRVPCQIWAPDPGSAGEPAGPLKKSQEKVLDKVGWVMLFSLNHWSLR